MTSLAKALPFFFLLVLFSSLQVETRQRLFFSKVTRSNGNEPEIPVTQDPAAPTPTPSYSPLYDQPPYAPAPELTAADAPTSSYSPLYVPTFAPAPESTTADAPAYSPSYTPAPESTAAYVPEYSPLSDVPTYAPAPESTAADVPAYSPLSDVPTYAPAPELTEADAPAYSPLSDEPTYAPAPESTEADAPAYSPLSDEPTYAPAPELTAADAPAYSPLYGPAADAQEEGALLVPAPAPFDSEPELGYGLFGSADQETPTSLDAENESRYENTNLYDDNSKYASNYNTDRYITNYNNGREGFTNSNDGNGARNGNNVDGFEQQGMSDTRSLENGSFYQDDDVKHENNDQLNGFQSGRGSTTNEAYFGDSEKPNELLTMDEYEKYQEKQGYLP